MRFAVAGLVIAAHRSDRCRKPFSIIHPSVAVGRKFVADVKIWEKFAAANELRGRVVEVSGVCMCWVVVGDVGVTVIVISYAFVQPHIHVHIL